MDGYKEDAHDFTFDLLAGIFAEQDRILAEEGEEALLKDVDENLCTVGASWLMLNEAGLTDAEILAEVHMRMYTDQGFTHISFE